MQLTNKTKTFIKELDKYNMPPIKNNDEIYRCLYHEIFLGFQYYKKIKDNIDYEIKRINNINKIPFPTSKSDRFFPSKIEDNIKSKSNYFIKFNFKILKYTFEVYFVYSLNNFDPQKYISMVITWLHIIINHMNKDCSLNTTILIYLTDEKKILPNKESEILDVINVNSAFTYCCNSNNYKNEIVVYRKEEWLKTFMHETIHAFGLDFCLMKNEYASNKIKEFFPIEDSEINLTESYCEFWAETFNILIISFLKTKKHEINEYLINVNKLMNYEKLFSIIQLIKTLNFMSLKYKDLYSSNKVCEYKRKFFYHENTNVFSYYIIKCILVFNLGEFIFWCNDNNISLIDFHKTKSNLDRFIEFIKTNCNKKNFIENIKSNEKLFEKFRNNSSFYNSMKMSLVEII